MRERNRAGGWSGPSYYPIIAKVAGGTVIGVVREQTRRRRCFMRRMKIGYRVSSGAVLVAFAADFVVGTWFHGTPPPRATGFDPCHLWVQMGVMEKLSPLVCFVSSVVLLVQGLRNRPAPRWLAVSGLVALPVSVWLSLWRVMPCYGGPAKTSFFLCIVALIWMHLHHLLQRRPVA